MTLTKFNNRPAQRSQSLIDDFFRGFPGMFDQPSPINAPVNIRETRDAFEMELVAPGFSKEDFQVNLENNLLTISAEAKKEENNEDSKQIRREYSYRAFKRSFTVDEQIDASNIQGRYENGILYLELPKRPEVKESIRKIDIK